MADTRYLITDATYYSVRREIEMRAGWTARELEHRWQAERRRTPESDRQAEEAMRALGRLRLGGSIEDLCVVREFTGMHVIVADEDRLGIGRGADAHPEER